MKSLLIILTCCLFSLTAVCQKSKAQNIPDKSKPTQLVEISCGKCQLGLKGKKCETAVRINGKSYYADGADIDDYGDAHANDGMCKVIRKAEVQGEIVNNRFKITYIKMLPYVKDAD